MGLNLFGTDDEDTRTDVKVCEDSFTNGIDRTRGCIRVVIPYWCLYDRNILDGG